MNYEIQQALSRKVDDYQFNVLRQEVDNLKSENRALSQKLGKAEAKLHNHYNAIEKLIQIMIDSNQFIETNELFEIRQYL
jgi:flagellar capping protein FliD